MNATDTILPEAFLDRLLPVAGSTYAGRVVVSDLGDRWKWDLYYFAIGALDFDAGSRQCLSGLHAANSATHSLSVDRNDLNVIFAVQRLEGRKSFSYFHSVVSLRSHREGNRPHQNVSRFCALAGRMSIRCLEMLVMRSSPVF